MPHTNGFCYEFGPYRLDPRMRILTQAGETIALTPKATELLLLLVMNAGQLVERNVLLREIWPDTFVEESNLTQNIFMLRRALGDERAVPRYIETVTRRGYRFIGSVQISQGAENEHENPLTKVLEAVADNPQPVVAVLPFIHNSEDTEIEYLGEGIAENIINNLSRVSKLRVMSRSAVFRYKVKEEDPRLTAKYLGADVVLVGKINSRPNSIAISVELVDAATGWQLWGESFDSASKDILAIQDAITRRVLATLKLELTGDEEKRVTARYTESAEAYQAYLEGRYHWSRYTKKGIEKAIGHFRQAIELDPNYALAYAGIVDCYLRLATNYLPPEDDIPRPAYDLEPEPLDESNPKVKLRFQWDWKGAERELRRANELKSNYPSAHQWYAAYRATQEIYAKALIGRDLPSQPSLGRQKMICNMTPSQIASLELTPSEEVQVCCAVAREQIDVGNYDAACRILESWWQFGSWPKVDHGLTQQSYGDLLFTIGELAGCVASTNQVREGQRHGEELLNGSIALFEQLGVRRRAAEARIELALCYYRQGLFDLGRSTLRRVLDDPAARNSDLRSLALIRLASLERHAGRLKDALAKLIEATLIVEESGPWATGRCHLELASTYKDLAISEGVLSYFDDSKHFYIKALYEFEAVGHHRYVAVVENNLAFLLLTVGSFQDAEKHLLRARRLFESFADSIRGAQVDETLARLYLETQQYKIAQVVIQRAVEVLELTDGEALLAEALTTNGVVATRLGRYGEAKKSFEAAYSVAGRCGDDEGAGRALLVMFEEISDYLEPGEKTQISENLRKLLSTTQQSAVQARVQKSLAKIESGEN